jgi:hypothetical protein
MRRKKQSYLRSEKQVRVTNRGETSADFCFFLDYLWWIWKENRKYALQLYRSYILAFSFLLLGTCWLFTTKNEHLRAEIEKHRRMQLQNIYIITK